MSHKVTAFSVINQQKMEISIEEASESDLIGVLELYKNTLDKNGKILPIEMAKQVFAKMTQYPDYKLFIAIYKKEIIGSFALLIMDNLAHFGTPSAIVEDVVVVENYQNIGVGKKMMQYAMLLAKQKGCYKMVLSSNQKRENAHQFYESLGFVKHGFSFIAQI